MEEVRSYWQVASITHFCTLFQKPFKLPQFEPEELEQAFIIDVPVCENQQKQEQTNLQIISNGHRDLENNNNSTDSGSEKDEEDNKSTSESIDGTDRIKANPIDTYSSSSGYLSSVDTYNRFQPPRNTSSYSSTLNYQNIEDNFQLQQQNQQQKSESEEQQPEPDLHLLVKLAIALLKPHFNSKITPNNWETYLKRIVEANWIELEHYPSPFRVPFVSPEGIELTKNLNFNDLPLSDKIDLFCALCDYRFWCNDASEAIKDYPIEELRLESIGKDQEGYEYWYFCGARLFREDKELTQDLISRKKRIKELEYELVEYERIRINREQEQKKRAEIEKARKLEREAREARQAAKRQHEEEAAAAAAASNVLASDESVASSAKKRKRNSNLILPPRTGLRERRSSAASNNHESAQQQQQQQQQQTPTRTTRGSLAKQNDSSGQKQQPQQSQSAQKTTRSSARGGSKNNNEQQQQQANSNKTSKKNPTPEPPKKAPEEECREELERLTIKPEDRKAAWSIHCESLEEWESFVAKFEKTKSTNERYLYSNLNEFVLPKIRAIYAKRAAEVRRKEKELLLSLTTRRVSTRIISKKAQEEEEERQAQLREIELQKKRAEAEVRLRAELEREMRARKNRFVINGGGTSSTCSEDGEAETNGRYKLRQQHNSIDDDPIHEFDGIIHPDKLSEFYEALELIVDTVRTSKHAWPFVDPVPNTVPGYYDLIKEPMDLKKLRAKVEFRAYKSLIELENDFQLLINNCERFNGPKNVYTKMVYKLWKSFRKNVQLYLQRDLHMNEQETFIYPPPQRPVAPPPPPPPPTFFEERGEEEGENSEATTKQPETLIKQSSTTQPSSLSIQQPDEQLHGSNNHNPKFEIETNKNELPSSTPIKSSELSQNNQQQEPINDRYFYPNHMLPKPTTESSIKLETLHMQPIETIQPATNSETIVEEIVFDTPDNDIYIWQDTIVQEGQ